jgi:hypothetical protein
MSLALSVGTLNGMTYVGELLVLGQLAAVYMGGSLDRPYTQNASYAVTGVMLLGALYSFAWFMAGIAVIFGTMGAKAVVFLSDNQKNLYAFGWMLMILLSASLTGLHYMKPSWLKHEYAGEILLVVWYVLQAFMHGALAGAK